MSSSSRSMRVGRFAMFRRVGPPSDDARAVSVRTWESFATARLAFLLGRAPRRRSSFSASAATPRARSTSRAGSGWTTRGPRSSGKLARRRRIALSVHAPIAGFMGHVERDRKHAMAVGMLDHSAGIAKAAGAEPVVFHPGFLLGRTRKRALAQVVEQLADLRTRLEGKGRGVPFGVEIMGRVREIGSLEDVLHIASQLALGAASDRLRAPARRHRRRLHDGKGVPRRPVGSEQGAAPRRAVPHPLLRHRVRQPERDEAPALRRGDATGRAAWQRRSPASRDRRP